MEFHNQDYRFSQELLREVEDHQRDGTLQEYIERLAASGLPERMFFAAEIEYSSGNKPRARELKSLTVQVMKNLGLFRDKDAPHINSYGRPIVSRKLLEIARAYAKAEQISAGLIDLDERLMLEGTWF